MEIAARSNMNGRECSHLLEVNNAYFPKYVQQQVESLRELGAGEKYKSFKDETVDKCIDK